MNHGAIFQVAALACYRQVGMIKPGNVDERTLQSMHHGNNLKNSLPFDSPLHNYSLYPEELGQVAKVVKHLEG